MIKNKKNPKEKSLKLELLKPHFLKISQKHSQHIATKKVKNFNSQIYHHIYRSVLLYSPKTKCINNTPHFSTKEQKKKHILVEYVFTTLGTNKKWNNVYKRKWI